MQDAQAQKSSQRATLRKRKGWIGFVHGYADWVKATTDEGRWDDIEWGKDGKESGAKSVKKVGDKTIYTY